MLGVPTGIMLVWVCYLKVRKKWSGHSCNDPDTGEFKIMGQGGQQEGKQP